MWHKYVLTSVKIWAIIVTSALTSCDNNGNTTAHKLAIIDSLIAKGQTDTAYTIINGIKQDELKRADDAMFYIMLRTELDTNHDIQTTDTADINRCIAYYKTEGNYKLLARSYYDKGILLTINNDMKKAISNIKKAESIENKEEYPFLRNLICANMAFINTESGAYNTALAYATKGLENAEKHKNNSWKSLAYNHLATCYFYLNQKDSAMYYAKKILPYIDGIRDSTEKAAYCTNTGYLFYVFGEYDKAEPLLRRALNALHEPMMELNLAKLCYAIHKDGEGDSLLKEAWKDADTDVRGELLQFLGEKAEKEKQFERSAEYYRRANEMRDSLATNKKTEERLAAQNDFERDETQKANTAKMTKAVILFGGIIILITAFSLIIYKSRTKRISRKLAYSKRITEKYQHELNYLQNSEKRNADKIERLEKKISEQRHKQAQILEHGRKLCEHITSGGTTAGWSKTDFEAAVEYMRAKMPKETKSIEAQYDKLTAYNSFFLMLGLLGISNMDITKVLNVSQGAVRATRFRLKSKQKKAKE